MNASPGTRWKVLITCPPFQLSLAPYLPELEEQGIEVVAPPVVQQFTEAELIELMADVDGVIAGDDPFTDRVLSSAARLKVLIKWGVGIDAIDLEAVRRLGLTFSNTPGAFGDEVADVALGYVIMLARQLHHIDRGVREGRWPKPPGMTLRGKSLGVVGLGSIGRAVVRRARAFGMETLGHDTRPVEGDFAAETGLREVGLDELLAASDFVVLCCNLTADNVHLMGAEQFARMKPDAYLVNVARGALVDESALVEALSSGRLAAAALDVFETEPLGPDHPLRSFDQCIFGTHNGSNTREAVERVNRIVLERLVEGLRGCEA